MAVTLQNRVTTSSNQSHLSYRRKLNVLINKSLILSQILDKTQDLCLHLCNLLMIEQVL